MRDLSKFQNHGHLSVKRQPQAQVFEHLVPSCSLFGKVMESLQAGALLEQARVWGST